MAAGVRVLGAEGRPEGVDLGQREAVGLDIELPRDRQERLAAEEILREIHVALRRARRAGRHKSGFWQRAEQGFLCIMSTKILLCSISHFDRMPPSSTSHEGQR